MDKFYFISNLQIAVFVHFTINPISLVSPPECVRYNLDNSNISIL